mmetsp:Transcript_21056/g.50115  ORF Transcript_21056/g.50115 Transcript_21056/m.50115 type:complete len:324 (+) Transcript_21056:743-1714(+)
MLRGDGDGHALHLAQGVLDAADLGREQPVPQAGDPVAGRGKPHRRRVEPDEVDPAQPERRSERFAREPARLAAAQEALVHDEQQRPAYRRPARRGVVERATRRGEPREVRRAQRGEVLALARRAVLEAHLLKQLLELDTARRGDDLAADVVLDAHLDGRDLAGDGVAQDEVARGFGALAHKLRHSDEEQLIALRGVEVALVREALEVAQRGQEAAQQLELSECGAEALILRGVVSALGPLARARHNGAGDDVLLGGGGLAEHAAVEEGGGLHDETRGGGASRVVDALGLGRRGAAAVGDSDAGRWGGAWLRPPRHHGRRGPRG